MPLPRMTTRRWIIGIATLALLVAPPAWMIRQLSRLLEEQYGPDGQVTRQHELSDGASAALELIRAGRFAEAEVAFRALGPLEDRFLARGWDDRGWSGPIRVGRAAAIAGQGRHEEAEPLFRAALNVPEVGHGLGTTLAAEGLGWYAATLRALGRTDEAAEVDARVAALHPAPATSP